MRLYDYHDNSALPDEVSAQFGRYVQSYQDESRRVNVHVFADDKNALTTAYVIKSPSVPVAHAHAVVLESLARARTLPRGAPSRSQVVFDSGIGFRSGSL